MRDQWQAATGALADGQPRVALERFREFARWYGNEPAAREDTFRERQLRLWGLAALQAGETGEGLPLLLEWLEITGNDAPYRAFIRFQVALACRMDGNPAGAASHWRAFLEEYPELPETALVRWMWADQLLAESKPGEARLLLEQVLEEPRLPPSGRALAQAALALVSLSMGDGPDAAARLAVPWPGEASTNPLHLWRALLAPALVSDLLDSQPETAHRVAAWFDRPENLRSQVVPVLDAARVKGHAARQIVWSSHWQVQLRRLAAAVEEAEHSETGMETLFRLRLRSFLKGGLPENALHLAEFLLLSKSPAALRIRSDCHAAAIEACLKLGLWKQADTFASRFVNDHPDDPGLPDILFLKARIAAERKDFAGATRQVQDLLEAVPDHPSVLAWRMTAASWFLEGGMASEALSEYEDLAGIVPRHWLPVLDLQRARCHDKLGNSETASEVLRRLTSNPGASAALREQAYTCWLGIVMRRMDEAEFKSILRAYRSTYPEGINRLTVENLAGTFASLAGDRATAETIFTAVSAENHPAAEFAHEQLSSLYRRDKAGRDLLHHARTWILQARRNDKAIPLTAMEDCRLYQAAAGRPALDGPLLAAFLELMNAGDPALPGIHFLGLLHGQWEGYVAMPGMDGGPAFPDWLESRRNGFSRDANWLPYAHCLLYEARMLEEEGRHDSADTRRIEVLKSVDPELLDADSCFAVAATADRYDFPEGVALLERFIGKFPGDPMRAEALYRLAGRLRQSGPAERAKVLLAEILTHWTDAAIHPRASLLRAEWALEDGDFRDAAFVLQSLLERNGLPPALAARALLLRARTDFKTSNPERGRTACRRILALYPAFHDITAEASLLLDQGEEPGKADNA